MAKRVSRIELSPTLKMSARTQELRREGVDIVDFSVGEPDFPTPEAIKKAGIRAIEENFTKYVANDGIADLKAAIIDKLEKDNGLHYKKDEIIVSPGAKSCLMNAATALLEEGDEVLIPTPCWVSYPDQVKLTGADPVFIPTKEEKGFLLDTKDLERAITARTKALVLNYPSNPTGALYSGEQLKEIAEICVKKNIWVVSDEIYEKLVYDGRKFVSIASFGEKIKSKTIVINGFSKAYSMTGWRLGYAAGPKEIISACSKIQSHNTSNATSFVQKAAVVALTSCAGEVEKMRAEFEKRRDMIVGLLQKMEGITVSNPGGAFYVMPNISGFLGRKHGGEILKSTYDLSYYLLNEAHTAVIPGEAFMSPSHIRLSFATSTERIREGVKRIGEALKKLS